MSAVMTPQTVDLSFKATRALPRRLSIELSKGGYLYVYARAGNYTVAHTCELLQDANLRRAWKPAALIVGGTHFHLAEPEAAEVERVFGPLGLRIDLSDLHSPIRAAGSGAPAGATAAECGDSKIVCGDTAGTAGPAATSPQGADSMEPQS